LQHDSPIDVGLRFLTLQAFTKTDLLHQGRLHFAIALLSFVLDQQQKINTNSMKIRERKLQFRITCHDLIRSG
jgi:hypothetical protein